LLKPLRRNASRTDPFCTFQTEVNNAAILELIFACQSMQARDNVPAVKQPLGTFICVAQNNLLSGRCKMAQPLPGQRPASGG